MSMSSAEYNRRYRERHKEKVLARERERKRMSYDPVKQKAYYEAHKEHIAAIKRAYQSKNRLHRNELAIIRKQKKDALYEEAVTKLPVETKPFIISFDE